MQCDVASLLPITEVIWSHITEEGDDCEADGTKVFNSGETTASFKLLHAKPSHQGSYMCSAKNNFGMSTRNAKIILTVNSKYK